MQRHPIKWELGFAKEIAETLLKIVVTSGDIELDDELFGYVTVNDRIIIVPCDLRQAFYSAVMWFAQRRGSDRWMAKARLSTILKALGIRLKTSSFILSDEGVASVPLNNVRELDNVDMTRANPARALKTIEDPNSCCHFPMIEFDLNEVDIADEEIAELLDDVSGLGAYERDASIESLE